MWAFTEGQIKRLDFSFLSDADIIVLFGIELDTHDQNDIKNS